MKGCSVNSERWQDIHSNCNSGQIGLHIHKIAEMFWKRVGKLPHGHSISIVPSQEMCTLCFGSHMC